MSSAVKLGHEVVGTTPPRPLPPVPPANYPVAVYPAHLTGRHQQATISQSESAAPYADLHPESQPSVQSLVPTPRTPEPGGRSHVTRSERITTLRDQLLIAYAEERQVSSEGLIAVGQATARAASLRAEAEEKRSAAVHEAKAAASAKNAAAVEAGEEETRLADEKAVQERAIAQKQNTWVLEQQRIITEDPTLIPPKIQKALGTFDTDKHMRDANQTADAMKRQGRNKATEILAKARKVSGDELREAVAQAESAYILAIEAAERLVSEAEEKATAAVQAAHRRTEALRAQLNALENPVAATSQPTAGKAGQPQKDGQVSPLASQSVPDAGARIRARLSLRPNQRPPRHDIIRPVLETARRYKVAVGGGILVTAVAVGGVPVLMPDNDRSHAEAEAVAEIVENGAQAPAWVPTSVKAWQEEMAEVLADPRVGVGPEQVDYVGEDYQEIPGTLVLLGSRGNHHRPTGLVPLDGGNAERIAGEMGVSFVVERPAIEDDPNTPENEAQPTVEATKETATDVLRVAVRRANEILDTLLNDPEKGQSYRNDSALLLGAFIEQWTVNDAEGNVGSLPSGYIDAFKAIAADWRTGASQSETLEAMLADQTLADSFKEAETAVREEKILTEIEEHGSK